MQSDKFNLPVNEIREKVFDRLAAASAPKPLPKSPISRLLADIRAIEVDTDNDAEANEPRID